MRTGRRGRLRVELARGGRMESVHDVDLAVVDAAGGMVARAGAAESVVFARSALKPFQALPLVEDGVLDRFGLGDEELALCCASHSSEPRHVEIAQRILDRIQLDETDLACGPHEPFSGRAARALYAAGREPGRIHNNCSGKHGGMLALARARGWSTEGYHELGHPVQQRVLDTVERWSGIGRERLGTGVDGCGVVTFALPLTALAGAFARLVAAADGDREDGAAREGEASVWPGAEGEARAASRVVEAMTGHPFLVGGSKRLCTALMEVTGGRILAKVGAEGVYGAAARDRGWGIALKVRDGARRAAEVSLVGVLDALGLLGDAERERLTGWDPKDVLNTRGEVVGRMRTVMEWSDDG